MKKFLMMFVMSFMLFFSVSIAEFTTVPSKIEATYDEFNVGSSFAFSDYSFDTIVSLLKSDNVEIRNSMLNAMSTSGYYVLFFNQTTEKEGDVYIIPKTIDFDLGLYDYSNTTSMTFYLDVPSGVSFYCKKYDGSYLKISTTSSGFMGRNSCNVGVSYFNEKITNDPFFYGNLPDVKLIRYNNGFYWTGEFVYQASTTPDTPSFEGLSDTQKATIINSVVNSDEFKNIVPEHYRNQFFIIKNEWTNRYKVYFYPKQYYLKGRVFEADETEAITQKSYKIIATDSENFLWGVWQSINPFDYYVFSGYFNEDYSFNSYFYEYKDSHEMNQEYFSYEDEPIVYSSKDIGFVIYDISTNETTEDTENSISSTILKDDYGNEIEIVIPTEEGTENITFWDSIVQKIVNGIKVIFVPDFSNSLDFFEKLKSKFNFLFEVKDLVSGMFNNLVYQTEPPSITIDLTTSNSKYNWGSNAIALDMSWYEPYKPSVDIFICAFCYGIFFWNLFRKLANIVSGVSGEGAQSSKEGSK